jgi:hypothetical protein
VSTNPFLSPSGGFPVTMPNDLFTTPKTEGRDAKGRFAKGNGLGRGNPFARRVAALRSALLEEVDDEKFRRMVRDLVEMALSKDLAAMKLVFQYVLGRPTPMVNPDDLDRLEWEQLRRDCVSVGDLHELADGNHVPVDLGNTVVKAAVGANGATLGGQMAQALRTGKLPGEDEPDAEGEPVEAPSPEAAEETAEEEPEENAKEGPDAPAATLPFPAVTTRGRRPGGAVNNGPPTPMKRANKRRNKKRRGKGRS